MTRYLCIHGHFYQPPRENPWIEEVEVQDSAYPFHDWNERVTNECYAPNAVSRILDNESRIIEVVNNYEYISFDFGPTLLQWLRAHNRWVYDAVVEADQRSRERFSGHGSAMAQAYNHMIMPLANRADKHTQISWGIDDFRHHFGRDPEGMWLPETAVDTETLEIMAERGIRFTVLAPRQAKAVRRKGTKEWVDVSDGSVDPKRAYVTRLPSGRDMNVFFYDGPVSRTIAFENLLADGGAFASRLLSLFSDDGDHAQLVHIATDGETYGHHHRHGDMALAYALSRVQHDDGVQLTNYGEFLEENPPEWEATIQENSSWSCAHGVERWRSDCGCHTGGAPGWNQSWRGPLRDALDTLRDAVWPLYVERASALFRDPVAARDDYVNVILDRTRENVDAFFARHAPRPLDDAERVAALELLELQRHAMLMYTSCGWFFNELSGIETVQVIQYAGRVIQLAQDLFDRSFESEFLSALEKAKSNIPVHQNGSVIYEKFVRPAIVDLFHVGAHYAIAALFNGSELPDRVYCYRVENTDHQRAETGGTSLVVGRGRITSVITGELTELTYGALHMGAHNISAGVREFMGTEQYRAMADEVAGTFENAEFSEIIRQFEKHFGVATYSLRSLFRDQQRRISGIILGNALERAKTIHTDFYRDTLPMMRFLASVNVPIPRVFYSGAEFVINSGLRAAFAEPDLDAERIDSLIEEAGALEVSLDLPGLSFAMRTNLERDMAALLESPDDVDLLERLAGKTALLPGLPFDVDLWAVQNGYYTLRTGAAFERAARAGGDKRWMEDFRALGTALHMRIE